MSLNFELPEDLIHNDTMELSETLTFSDELYDLGLDAYEPNEFMFKAVQDLKLFFNDKSNCKCRAKNAICFEKIGFENFLERLSQLRGLDDNERDLCVKSQLMVFQFSKSENNKQDSYKYQYNSSIPICRPVFLKLCGIGKSRLLALQKHLNMDGLIERIHGNTNKVPQNKSRVNIYIIKFVSM